jgi:hypothetical protein
MDSRNFAEWLSIMPVSARIRALALIYSNLTISTRELFLPAHAAVGQGSILSKLNGLNELHHKIAGQLAGLSTDATKTYPTDVFSNILFEVAEKHHVSGFLNSAIEFSQTRDWTAKQTK